MIAVAELTPRQRAAKRQWADPRARTRLLCAQLIAQEKRRVDRLVRDNLHLPKLAASHAERMTGLPREDYEQAAFLGLTWAARTFDPTKGAAFGTWAWWGMRAATRAEYLAMRSVIRVPKQPRSPIPKCSSLDLSHPSDDGSTTSADIPDDHTDDPAAALHRAELPRAVAAALAKLDPKDALVVELRYGINGARREHSFAEIAERLDVCPEWARKIAERACTQLRDALTDFAL